MNKLDNQKNKKYRILIPSIVSIVISIAAEIIKIILKFYTSVHSVRILNLHTQILMAGGIFGIVGALLIIRKKPKPTGIELVLALLGVILPIILKFSYRIKIF